ncbi:MAG: efflux RND transporter periplasmic adaptor subunit [Desulfobacula sp.]|uniref:efflux RND transporter periplasmic adaptor subunit n=1 Tax=Desulfobacula sp. TaxID=2593537 RepID=UPI0025BC28DE|nr:efflux RND transporter periplasmic adaptor subunit [Desulfobacula sp.]MCD4719201.1 efflux RND transporter periplasmic adaptor subunit [Desulfobacula sp.]
MSVLIKWGSVVKLMIKITLPVCLILAGFAGWSYFKAKEPKMKRKPPQKQIVVVETISMKPGDYQSSVQVMGTVMPDRQIILKSKVSGEVISISPRFVLGGVMKKGEILLKLDDSDYRIEIQKAQSALDKALSYLAIEKGSQLIAKEELKLINEASQGEVKATDLALRKPQLIQAKAEVDRAMADLEKAQLNLSRAEVVLPFNALVFEKYVNLGSLVTVQGSLAVLVDVDTYRVEAQVPPDRLAAFSPGQVSGSDAIIYSQYSNHTWQGKVVRTTGKMTEKSRMAGVIILVNDPLGLKRQGNNPQLLLNDHVDVRIMGETLKNVFLLSRSILRDGNTVWVYHAGVLEIKKVSLVWKEDGEVYIRSGVKSGIRPGDRVITSDLPAPVKGMALQLASGDRP